MKNGFPILITATEPWNTVINRRLDGFLFFFFFLTPPGNRRFFVFFFFLHPQGSHHLTFSPDQLNMHVGYTIFGFI